MELSIIWENQKGYILGTHALQEFVIVVDNRTEIEEGLENNLMHRKVSILQYVLYIKNGNNCERICRKNKLYDTKLIAKQILKELYASNKSRVLQ